MKASSDYANLTVAPAVQYVATCLGGLTCNATIQGSHLQQQLGARPAQLQAHLQQQGQGQGQVHSQQQQQQGPPQQQGGAQPQQLQPQHLQGMPPIGGAIPASNGVPAASSAQLQSLQSPVRSATPQKYFRPHNRWGAVWACRLCQVGVWSRRDLNLGSFPSVSH